MRQTHSHQLRFGQTPIEAIQLDIRSRDDMTQILLGLQHLYTQLDIREQVFAYLESLLPEKTDPQNGRPGMYLWNILVLGIVKLGKNIDFDCLTDLANQHHALRQMLGHDGLFDSGDRYALQTVRDNLKWFTPEVLAGINQIIVQAGHRFAKFDHKPLRGKCDSYVVETNIHYPTDINVLWDAVRCLIRLCEQTAQEFDISGWRQATCHHKRIKSLYRAAQNSKRSNAKDPEKVKAKEVKIQNEHQAYLDRCADMLQRSEQLLADLASNALAKNHLKNIKEMQKHLLRQMDHIKRRVIEGEVIPHTEKVFSIFQEHSEWISKGKAGVPVEFGLRVAVMTDQLGFILHHLVMEKQTDDQVAICMVTDTQKQYPRLVQASFDKGFYSVSNLQKLPEYLDLVVMPKKGKLSKADATRESSPEFAVARRKHSAVESSINALEHSGLDICRDHGLEGFKRYVALGIVARNIKILGTLIQRKKKTELRQQESISRLAA